MFYVEKTMVKWFKEQYLNQRQIQTVYMQNKIFFTILFVDFALTNQMSRPYFGT